MRHSFLPVNIFLYIIIFTNIYKHLDALIISLRRLALNHANDTYSMEKLRDWSKLLLVTAKTTAMGF